MKSPILVLLVLVLGACGSAPSPNAYTPLQESTRDTSRAEQLNREASDQIKLDPKAAEKLLREALTADIFYGPAHNNLGVLYLRQDKFYEAANEFQWAAKLMPGYPDPRLNLGLVLQQAGQVDGALKSFRSAIEVYADHIPTLQALASLLVSHGREDERLDSMLKKIALRGESEEWRDWARQQRIRREGRR